MPTGTENADTLLGTGAAETFDALGGGDVVFAAGGNDTVFAGADDDLVDGDSGDDSLSGQADNDTLIGGAGDDLLDGGTGSDTARYSDFVFTDPAAELGVSGSGWSLAAGEEEATDQLESIELVVDAAGARVLLVGQGGFGSIQAAVSVAQDGDTILIAPGVYAEQVVIDGFTGLTIIGLPGAALHAPGGSGPLAVSAPGVHALLAVLGSTGVTVSGLVVDGDSQGNRVIGGNDYIGIYVEDSAGTVLDGVTVREVRDALEPGSVVSGNQRGNAVVVFNSGAPAAFTLTDSTIEDFQKTGLAVSNAEATITGNTVTGSGSQPIIAQNGIQLDSGTFGEVSGNTVTGIAYGGPQGVISVSLLVFDSTGGLTVSGNTLTGAAGAGDAGLYVIDSANVTATGNTIADQDFAAIDLGDLAPLDGSNALSDNSFTGNDANLGVFVQPGQVTGLAATGTPGADFLFGGAGEDTLVGLGGDDVLAGEDPDFGIGAGDADTLTGGDGDDDLDGGSGIDTATYSGAIAVGDFTSGAGTWTLDAGDEDTDTLTRLEIVDGAEAGRILLVDAAGGGFATIQAAVDAAIAGDTILIADGTYVEQVTITTGGITLRGESRDGVIIRSPAVPVVQGFYAGFAPDGDVTAVIAVIDATGVVIENLTVDGDARLDEAFGAGADDFFGVVYLRSSGTVASVTVQGVLGDNGFFGVQAGEGIGVLAEDGFRQSFTLTDSLIRDFQKTGLLTFGVDLTATGNAVEAIQTPEIGQNGIQLSRDTRGTVSGNSVTGIGYNGAFTASTDAAAILVLDSAGTLDITNNTLAGSGSADDTAVFVYDSLGVTLSGNTISGFAVAIDAEDDPAFGLNFDPANPSVFEPNTLSDIGISLVFDVESDDFGAPTPTTVAFSVDGTGGDDDLRTSAGNDTLGGSAGADLLTGRAGNHVYLVEGDDTVIEGAGEGIDRIDSSVTVTALAANVENLTLTGTGDIDGTGNALANIIFGNAGNNVLDGAGGSDSLRGRAGNDTYLIASADAGVIELVAEGTDTILSAVRFSLGNVDNVENLTLTGAAKKGSGNSLDNVIEGSDAVSKLKGAGGDDTILGAGGRDVLSGNGGSDVFRFLALGDSGTDANSADRIKDFNQSQEDLIDISAIDAAPLLGGEQAFSFIGTAAFTGVAGQVRYFFDGGRTFIQLSTGTDQLADMVIRLEENVTLLGTDFIL